MTKTRVLITVVVSFLLLVAVIAAGLNAVFTVTLIQAEFSVFSEEGREEASALKEELDSFVGKSTTFLDLEDVRAVVEENPWFYVTSLEKKYPSTVVVEVAERKETFALARESGYAVLAENGFYLGDRNSSLNRSSGENIRLEGFDFELVQGQIAGGEMFEQLMAVYGVFREALAEVRANVLSITYVHGQLYNTLFIQMREGIAIEIVDPAQLTEEKVRAALSDEQYGYLVRSDGERLSGRITVIASGEQIQVDYDFLRN